MREGIFIALADGTRLAARVWLPEDADDHPVPAVLEYLPYRLNDAMASGDHQQMSYFAGCGIAGVRVDIRGSGESDGLCPDEYTEQEQLDCLEVIAWIAGQPWCTGAVGMMGYSWSGFNCLQVAARRPPALNAIASIFASDDRYADDVHYRGGLVIPMEMVHWSTCILGWQARPPDQRIVGDRWHDLQAGTAVGARGLLVRTGYGREAERTTGVGAVGIVDDLIAAASWIFRTS